MTDKIVPQQDQSQNDQKPEETRPREIPVVPVEDRTRLNEGVQDRHPGNRIIERKDD